MRCHPQVPFPADWSVTHSMNHWSNQDTMETYVEERILPYIKKQQEHMPVSPCTMKWYTTSFDAYVTLIGISKFLESR